MVCAHDGSDFGNGPLQAHVLIRFRLAGPASIGLTSSHPQVHPVDRDLGLIKRRLSRGPNCLALGAAAKLFSALGSLVA